MSDQTFKIHLVQNEWVITEEFNITAKDEKAALAEAQNIADSKELKGKKYRLEVAGGNEEPQEPAAGESPSEPVER